MKNIKVNENLVTRIVSGGLSLVLVATGVAIGKFDSKKQTDNMNPDKILNQYLDDYIEERSRLEEEIEELLKQKETLKQSKEYNVQDLIVIKHNNADNESELSIVYPTATSGIYSEYHDAFLAWYQLHDYTEEHVHDFCPKYVHFYEGRVLFDCLTQEEKEKVENSGGKITTFELDNIIVRLKEENDKKLSR